jgi:hypothetical protein
MHARFALIVICALAASSTALAQDLDNDEDGYLFAKLMLGLGGEVSIDAEDAPGGAVDDDMELTYGVGLGYMHPFHQNFALGAQLALLSWTSDGLEAADADRSMLIDISLVPQPKFAVSENVELYVSIPLGLTLDSFGGDDYVGNGAANAEVTGGVGFNLALLLGARFALGDSAGLLAEIGYAYHAFSHTVEAEVLGVQGESDFDVSIGQFALNVGGWFSL